MYANPGSDACCGSWHGGRRYMHAMFHGPHRYGGGRMFGQGALRLVILSLIAEQPRHGYELIKEIEGRFGGAYSPSPGVIYPSLALLEEQDLIRLAAGGAEGVEEGGKKRYAITEAGRRFLAENEAKVGGILARMAEAGAGGEAGRAQLFRAMHNLRTALRLRLARGRLTDDELRRIISVLDETTQTIERA